jgi:hypothetical protein
MPHCASATGCTTGGRPGYRTAREPPPGPLSRVNKDPNPQSPDQPVVLVKWYDDTRWVLELPPTYPGP